MGIDLRIKIISVELITYCKNFFFVVTLHHLATQVQEQFLHIISLSIKPWYFSVMQSKNSTFSSRVQMEPSPQSIPFQSVSVFLFFFAPVAILKVSPHQDSCKAFPVNTLALCKLFKHSLIHNTLLDFKRSRAVVQLCVKEYLSGSHSHKLLVLIGGFILQSNQSYAFICIYFLGTSHHQFNFLIAQNIQCKINVFLFTVLIATCPSCLSLCVAFFNVCI